MSEKKPINWTHARTLIALAILVGTELVGLCGEVQYFCGVRVQIAYGVVDLS